MSIIIYWLIGFIIFNLIFGTATWKLYRNAGKLSWQAYIPFINVWEGLSIIRRPKYWVILFYIPVVGPILWLIFFVDLGDVYGKIVTKDKIIIVLTLGLYLFVINYSDNPKYLGPEKRKPTLLSSLLFALVLASLVHNWFIQPMVVPTGSMENTIKIGDALFVEKVSNGIRIPVTPIGIPFSELIYRKGFINSIRLPYMRLPGWRSLKSNDIVVFNYPTDSVYSAVDRKDPYVKRLVGLPGQTVQVRNGVLYVDGKKFIPKKDAQVQHAYMVITKTPFSDKLLYDNFGINPIGSDFQRNDYFIKKEDDGNLAYYFKALTDEHVAAMKSNSNVISIKPILDSVGQKTEHIVNGRIDSANTIFPVNKDWNPDQYGPLYIPKKGDIVEITKESLPQYINILRKYEHNNLRIDSTNGKFDVFINNSKSNKYKIKQNYYFMMGDNRNQSLDARFFGYVGEDHIIGRPIMIWANMNGIFEPTAPKKFIWNRFFTSINNDNPNKTSYGIYVLILLILYMGYDIVKARKNKKKNKY